VSLSARIHTSIAGIGRAAWDAHAAPTGNPFLGYDFLEACEASDSVHPREGWGPRHLTLEDGGDVLGVMPLYLKGHSQGEYVFDHSWADAFERAGGIYYPKLLSAVPFTPVTGPRLLAPTPVLKSALASAAVSLAEREGLSSLHINFPNDADQAVLVADGFLARQDRQFVWRNRDYETFDAFLNDLSSNHRKTIRRERREAHAGLDIRVLTGGDLTEAMWDAFFEFYMDTGSRKWGRPYLNRRFFSEIGTRMADRIALVMAFEAGLPIAGALNFIGAEALYGRQWGTVSPRPFLHFELCYYQAIELAISLGLDRVEAGAQGDHKLSRGYLPRTVHSAHYIAHPGLRRAVADYLDQEREAVSDNATVMIENFSPFRHNDKEP